MQVQAGLGWGGGSTEQMCMLHAVVLLWLWPSSLESFGKRPRGGRSAFYYFDDSSTSTMCLYFRSSQLCLTKRIGTFYARARTHTCPCAYARARTLAARGSRQKCMRMDTGSSSERTEHSRGGASCSLRPRRRETSTDAPPFLKAPAL